mgnify:CR=1 FL=1
MPEYTFYTVAVRVERHFQNIRRRRYGALLRWYIPLCVAVLSVGGHFLAVEGKGKVGQSQSVFLNRGILYVCTAHQFQIRSFIEVKEIRFESFLGVDVLFIAAPVEVTGVELFHLFQSEGPDGDMMYSHESDYYGL